ncbi:mucin, putative, partial [Trypanosoma cruzi]
MMTCRLLYALLVLACAAARPCARQKVCSEQYHYDYNNKATNHDDHYDNKTTNHDDHDNNKATNYDYHDHDHCARGTKHYDYRDAKYDDHPCAVKYSQNRRQPQQLCVGVCPAASRRIRAGVHHSGL